MAAAGVIEVKAEATTDPPAGYSDRTKVYRSIKKSQADGAGADQIDTPFAIEVTVPQGSNIDVDIYAALDQAGAAFALTDVKWIIIEANDEAGVINTQNVTMTPSIANGWTNYMEGTTPSKTLTPGKVLVEIATGDGDLVMAAGNGSLNFATGAGVNQSVTIRGAGAK